MPERLLSSAQQHESRQSLQNIALHDLEQGIPQEMVIQQLIDQGMNKASATQMVTSLQLHHPMMTSDRSQDDDLQIIPKILTRRNEDLNAASKGIHTLLIGLIFFIVSSVIVFVCYMNSEVRTQSSTYTICGAAMVFGVIQIIRGLVTWLQNR